MEYTVTKQGEFEIRHYELIDSTNEEAKRILKNQNVDNIVLVADEQSGGKGRGGKEWVSEAGNLFFSLIIDAKRINEPHIISFIAALSVAGILENRNLSSKIKWPNDVLIDEKKLCGILVEKVKDHLIVGVGVNIVSSPSYLDSGRKATYMQNYIPEIDTAKTLSFFLKNFENIFKEHSDNGFENIRKKVIARLYKLNEKVELDYLGKKMKARIADISENGDLVVRTEKGDIETYKTGEIFAL